MRDSQDYSSLYPEPPQGVFAPMDLNLSPDGCYPRAGQDCYPTTMGYDGNVMYAEVPYMFNGGMSPNMYHDEAEMRVPSSNLSTASAPSAASSAVGSPRSNHGQPAPVPEWAGPQGLGVSPGIVGHHEYFPTGTEYGFNPPIEEYPAPFDFAQPKQGFVGESEQVPRSHQQQHGSFSSSISRDSSSTVVPESILAMDIEPSLMTESPSASPASSRKSSLVFASPTNSSSSLSSPPHPAWSSPPCAVEGLSPIARNKPPRPVSTFFSQSSGHFVAPLDSSYPSILHPDVRPMAMPAYENTYPPPPNPYNPCSPALSGSPQLRNGSTSPFPNYAPYGSPFPTPMEGRRPSINSFSGSYVEPHYSDGESKERQRCPHPDCGKTFKDLKAHMLTHQTERPEKCPIQTCDYHVKGFARKYDKNRHTLTHYKGTMVCGFCPGSGSAAEKSFNRADVFKRHLTAVHGVEQTPPNSRKKTAAGVNSGKKLTGYAPDATGKCSTCSQTFSNAQDFYEHLDDCVLRIVQQEDPAEAVNAKRLAEVENDREVHATLEKAHLPITTQATAAAEEDDDDEMDDDEAADDDFKGRIKTSASPTKKAKGNPANGVQKSRGMTHSRGGVPLVGKNRGRKNRRDYPSSWGFDKGQMTMKKRVMAVFDGPRRLAKDDLMLSTEQEVRVKLADGKYITDLDVQTMKRAEGFHNASEEEKGPWISDDPTEDQLAQMAAAQRHI